MTMDGLPYDAVYHIFQQLGVPEYCKMAMVSKKFNYKQFMSAAQCKETSETIFQMRRKYIVRSVLGNPVYLLRQEQLCGFVHQLFHHYFYKEKILATLGIEMRSACGKNTRFYVYELKDKHDSRLEIISCVDGRPTVAVTHGRKVSLAFLRVLKTDLISFAPWFKDFKFTFSVFKQ
jgi:hypothetical protein